MESALLYCSRYKCKGKLLFTRFRISTSTFSPIVPSLLRNATANDNLKTVERWLGVHLVLCPICSLCVHASTAMATSYEIEACNSSSSTSLLLGGSHGGHGGVRDGSEVDGEGHGRASSTYSAHRKSVCTAMRRTSTRILLCCLAGLAIVAGLFATDGMAGVSVSYIASKAKDGSGYILKTFTSASEAPYYAPSPSQRPPALSSLPDSLKRITLVSIWSGSNDKQPDYLNNFFRSAALNAKVADLVVIHVTNDASKCLSELRDDGISRNSSAWDWENGGNIRIVCQSRETHLAEEADFLCSKEGWGCDEETRKQVVSSLLLLLLTSKRVIHAC